MYILKCYALFKILKYTFTKNNGKHILWEHLCHLHAYTQAESGLYVGHRLTYEHVHLTSYSKMKVNLAAQVFIYNCNKLIGYIQLIITIIGTEHFGE